MSNPSLQRLWHDADQAPIAAIRRYVNTRARAYREREAGEIDKALVTEQRAEEAFAKAQALINPDDREDLADLLLHVQASADDLAASASTTKADWLGILPDTCAGRTQREIAIVERALGAEITPSKADGDVLLAKGYDPRSWAPYIIAQAQDYGVPVNRAILVWSVLGATEAFDGFVTSLQDMEGDGE